MCVVGIFAISSQLQLPGLQRLPLCSSHCTHQYGEILPLSLLCFLSSFRCFLPPPPPLSPLLPPNLSPLVLPLCCCCVGLTMQEALQVSPKLCHILLTCGVTACVRNTAALSDPSKHKFLLFNLPCKGTGCFSHHSSPAYLRNQDPSCTDACMPINCLLSRTLFLCPLLGSLNP